MAPDPAYNGISEPEPAKSFGKLPNHLIK